MRLLFILSGIADKIQKIEDKISNQILFQNSYFYPIMNILQKTRNWLSLFTSNFLGVFNNNFVKNLVCFVAAGWVFSDPKDNAVIVSLASGLYVISYIFFSPLAGRFAGMYNKRRVMIVARVAEIPVFVLIIAGFWFKNVTTVMTGIFILGLISTLFSPSKYGLIRDIGGEKGIPFGTGTMEMLTMLGVLVGTLIASYLSDHFSFIAYAAVSVFGALTALASIAALKVTESPTEKNPDDTVNPVKFVVRSFRRASAIKGTNLIVAGLAGFWMTGNMIQMNLMVHCPNVLKMTNTETGIVMIIAALGIGIGSFLTGLLSKGKIRLAYTATGGLGLAVCMTTVYVFEPSGWFFTSLIFLTAFFCGVYMVPLSSYVQGVVKGRQQGEMIAYSNFATFLFILVSSGIFGLVAEMIDTNLVFLIIDLFILSMTIAMFIYVPGMMEQVAGLFKKKKDPLSK